MALWPSSCIIVSFGCSPCWGLSWLSSQTEVAGGQNPHGLAAGWAWCARLLNNIPADRNTASALEAFLKVRLPKLNCLFLLLEHFHPTHSLVSCPHASADTVYVSIITKDFCFCCHQQLVIRCNCLRAFVDGRIQTLSSLSEAIHEGDASYSHGLHWKAQG